MPCGYHEAGEDAFKYVCGGFAVIMTSTSAPPSPGFTFDVIPPDDAQETTWEGSEVSHISSGTRSIKSNSYEPEPWAINRDKSHYFIEVTLLVSP